MGKFFSDEQCRKILRILILTSGIEEGSKEYASIVSAVRTLDDENITNYNESKNYSIMNGIYSDDSEKKQAINALVATYKYVSEGRSEVYDDMISWIVALRRATSDQIDTKMELALFEYSRGNVDEATTELKKLANDGALYAIELLACIRLEAEDAEGAAYYYAVMKKIYETELHTSLPAAIYDRINDLKTKISPQSSAEIAKTVEALPKYFGAGTASGKSIGFMGDEDRGFTI